MDTEQRYSIAVLCKQHRGEGNEILMLKEGCDVYSD